MACGTFLQNAQGSDRHLERDPRCPTSTMEWLPPRVSFSKDFARPIAAAAHIPRGIMKEIAEHGSPARYSGKESPSEFEFSMSIQGQGSSYGGTMLTADELFCEGKLLPLYLPQHPPESDLAAATGRGKANCTEFVQGNGRTAEQVTENSSLSGPRSAPTQKVEQSASPISPKAPTCTSRWKELFGLTKKQIQEGKDASKQQLKGSSQSKHPDSLLITPGRSSVDAGNDPKISSQLHSEAQNRDFCFVNQDQVAVAAPFPSEPLSAADPGLSPSTHLQNWPMDRVMSGSRSSKSSDDSEGAEMRSLHMQKAAEIIPAGPGAPAVKHRNSTSSRAKSPTKSSDLRNSAAAMSPRRGGRGVSPGRPSVGSRPTESSRNAIAARLVVRGLDRSYSSPKPMRKRGDQQARTGSRQRGDGSRSLERSTSYSAGVRVSPVINVPVYISPGLRKGSKMGMFTQLFSSKKEKASKLSASSPHPAKPDH